MLTMSSLLPWAGLFGPFVLGLVYAAHRHTWNGRYFIVHELPIDHLEAATPVELPPENCPSAEPCSEPTPDDQSVGSLDDEDVVERWRAVRMHRRERLRVRVQSSLAA